MQLEILLNQNHSANLSGQTPAFLMSTHPKVIGLKSVLGFFLIYLECMTAYLWTAV